jgi:hypothetical protein
VIWLPGKKGNVEMKMLAAMKTSMTGRNLAFAYSLYIFSFRASSLHQILSFPFSPVPMNKSILNSKKKRFALEKASISKYVSILIKIHFLNSNKFEQINKKYFSNVHKFLTRN